VLFIPVVYGVILDEERYGHLNESGDFVETENPTLGPIRRVEAMAGGVGLELPCRPDLVDEEGVPVAFLEIRVVHGRVGCVRIEALPGHELTGKVLRQAPIRKLVSKAAASNIVHLREGFAVRYLEGMFGQPTPDMSWRGRKLDDGFLREVATAYREAESRGMHPALSVWRKYGTSRENARRWIMLARRRGFLEAYGSS